LSNSKISAVLMLGCVLIAPSEKRCLQVTYIIMTSSFLVKMDQLAAKKAGNGVTEGDAVAAVASAQVGKQKIKDLVINAPSEPLLVHRAPSAR
jgi:Na+/alanine symporter